jgi:hypothetical protein
MRMSDGDVWRRRTLVVDGPGAARERGGPRSMKFDWGGEGGVGIGFDGYDDVVHGERPPGAGYIGCCGT